MSNLARRVLTGVVGVPLLAALVLWRERPAFGVFTVLVSALGMREFTAMMLPASPPAQRFGLAAIGAGFTAGLYLFPGLCLPLTTAALILTAFTVLVAPGDLPHAGARLGLGAFGVFYVGGLTALLGLLHRQLEDGPRWVLLALAATFANDTAAYFVGRAFGRHKLYPTISPGKTVEGAVGGVLGAIAALFLVRATFFPILTAVDCVLLGLPASLLGPVGDLVESLLKRSAGVKDSGRLLPGHGGLLDRIDALLFVGAWVYVYARYLLPAAP
jgi:phosphatidate cytidylyltransferase